ncbi:TonB-dependent receptor [Sphingomonas sp. PR090111-T3T-6A]|uniref:TonB-dependent receptor n=1 Tax=Sphingomonas sp. PR090111-T3T-6A TaxID=685778 RepID=UPI00036D40A0|nr:TonB-dependent receptor [Sphingomonas sp. PR090111-T3T-6A]
MRTSRHTALLALSASFAFGLPIQAAHAGDASAAATTDTAASTDASDTEDSNSIIVTSRRTRSVVAMEGPEIQKILPGISPLKAIQTLPGVTYLTADPWGNNEQNISLFVHGFNAQQLGYTLDGVPLGDQTYGNFNGLSPQRAIISEDVGRVTLASGAGDLGTASTSNLGGTIDTFSSDPRDEQTTTIQQTFGSYDTFRTYGRIDTGTFGNGNKLYFSAVRQDAKAWDFNGKQGGYQADIKFVHDDSTGKLTYYFAYSDKTEPNEDATVINPAKGETVAKAPYTRPFFYGDLAAAEAYYPSAANGFKGSAAYQAAGDNYRNYYSDAQRTDYLTYAKYDWNVSDKIHWSNQGYFHHDDGVGVVAGPIGAAGLPQLFSFYFPLPNPGAPATDPANLAGLSKIFGNSGMATRTTEYRIDRGGVISTLRASLGNHEIEVGGWYEHQSTSAYRRWYAFDINNPTTPYQRPLNIANPLITQYGSEVRVNEYQYHVQDAWHIRPNITLQAGFKGEFQDANQRVTVQPIPGSFSGSRELPNGSIKTNRGFLPQVGGTWDVTGHDQLFFNIQKNMRQFQTSAAAGLSPFALGSQTLFDAFKANTKPETSWTYEFGARTQHELHLGPITGFEGQLSYYHVNFQNRLLAVSPTQTITAIVSGATIINNVGGVTTDGVDIAGTLHFGPHFSFYDALSYNNSEFDDNYVTGSGAAQTTVHTKGKKVPGSPDWLNKFIASANYGIFDVQLVGDYMGKRYATYTNDLSTPAYFTMSARIGAKVPLGANSVIHEMNVSLNVTNLTDKKAASTLSIGAASGTYNYFPVAPREVFGTIGFKF